MNIELTEATINNSIKTCNSSRFLRDAILAGFGVRIYPTGKVSYIIEPTVNGSTRRRVIGKYPALSVSRARELAKERILELISTPALSATPATFPTLKLAYKDYITQIQLKASSISEYNVVIKGYLSSLNNTPHLDYTVTRHDLMRTFASYASEAGCDYRLIKRALNHSVSDITARYILTSPKTLSPVFEAVTELVADHRYS